MNSKQLAKHMGHDAAHVAGFASRVGVASSTVYRWIRGTSVPSTHLRKAIETETGGAIKATSWGKKR